MIRSGPEHGGRCHGFTLVEILVVAGIIGILAALIFPQINALLLRGQLVRTNSNLRQIGGAMFTYVADNNGSFPPNGSGVGVYAGSLRPYLGETNLTGPQTLLNSVFYTPAQKTPYFIGSSNNGYALSYGMNGYIGVTNNSVLTAGTRLSLVARPSKMAMLMDFQNHYVITAGTDATDRIDALKQRYGGQIAVLFVDGHTENRATTNIFPVDLTIANAPTNSFWLGK